MKGRNWVCGLQLHHAQQGLWHSMAQHCSATYTFKIVGQWGHVWWRSHTACTSTPTFAAAPGARGGSVRMAEAVGGPGGSDRRGGPHGVSGSQ